MDLEAKKLQLKAEGATKGVVKTATAIEVGSKDAEILPADMSEHQVFFFG